MKRMILMGAIISTVLYSGAAVATEEVKGEKEVLSKLAGCQSFFRVEAEVRIKQGLDVREEVLKEKENYAMLYALALVGMKQRSNLSDREFAELLEEQHSNTFKNIPRDHTDTVYQSYLKECKKSGAVYQLAKLVAPKLNIKFK